MTKTKEIIRELFEHYNIDSWRSKSSSERVLNLINEFGCSRGVAYNVSTRLSIYSVDTLFHIYFPEYFGEGLLHG